MLERQTSPTTNHIPPADQSPPDCPRGPHIAPHPRVGSPHRRVLMKESGAPGVDHGDLLHACPGRPQTSPATSFPPTASGTCKATFRGTLACPEWSLQPDPSGIAGELHGSEKSEVAVPTLQLASPSTLSQRMTAAKPLLWRDRGELPQLPWQRPCQGLVLVVDL